MARKDTHTNQWRPSDSRKKITTSKRFDLKFFRVLSKNRHPGILLWCLCSQECGRGLLVYAERIRTYNTALPSSAFMPFSPERPVHVKRRPSGRRLSNDQGDRNENGKTSNRFRLVKQQLCTSSKPFFAHFFAVFARLKL